MWSCCGLGRRKHEPAQPDERTALLDTDALPFVPPNPPKAIDDEVLAAYQARLERIIDEAAEKLVTVSTAGPLSQVSVSSSRSASGSSSSTSSRPHGHAKDKDTLWRAEHRVDTSVYSMKPRKGPRASSSSSSSPVKHKKGQSKLANGTTAHDDEYDPDEFTDERFHTVKSRLDRGPGDDIQPEDSVDSGEETPTPTPTTAGTRGSRGQEEDDPRSGKRHVQDIWSEDGKTASTISQKKNNPQNELDRALAMSEDEFARLLTQ